MPDEVGRTRQCTLASYVRSVSTRWDPTQPSAPVTRPVRPFNRLATRASMFESSPCRRTERAVRARSGGARRLDARIPTLLPHGGRILHGDKTRNRAVGQAEPVSYVRVVRVVT